MKAPSLFQIVPFKSVEELPEPDNGPYYTMTQNGYMLVDRNMFGKYITPVKEIPALPALAPTFLYDIPQMPSEIIGKAYSFFKSIYEQRKSEAMVDITWSEAKGYRLFVPHQRASSGGVQAERNAEHYKGQIVGTIHSHCNFGAFHSGTDTHDADGHDGLHITLGNLMSNTPSIAIMASKGGSRWEGLKLDDIQDGPIVYTPHPRWWEGFVKQPIPANKSKHISGWTPGHAPMTNKDDGKGKAELMIVNRTGGQEKKPAGGTKKSAQREYNKSRMTYIQDVANELNITNPKELELLGGVELELDTIIKLLHEMDIDFDYDFGIVPLNWRASSSVLDGDPDYEQWRYVD